MFVLDCSVAMSWCFEDEYSSESADILIKLHDQGAVVPPIWSLEVSNVLHIAERNKRISAVDADQFINLINGLPIEIDPCSNNLINKQILDLSRRFNLSAYDAAYLELALRYKVPLLSFDKKLRSITVNN